MQPRALFIVVGAVLLSAGAAVAQSSMLDPASTIRRDPKSGELYHVVLRAPEQSDSPIPMEHDVFEENLGETLFAGNEVRLRGKEIYSISSQCSGCRACAKNKPVSMRRFLDRFTTGLDYMFFGVSKPNGAKGRADCECDLAVGCDAYVPGHTGGETTYSSSFGELRSGEVEDKKGLSDYFEEFPSGNAIFAPAEHNAKSEANGRSTLSPSSKGDSAGDSVPKASARRDESSVEGQFTPATRIPPRLPVAPLQEVTSPRKVNTIMGNGASAGEWKPLTDPFEDDPLPRK